jgi:hypothetical protein
MMPIRPPGWEHGGTGRGRAAATFSGWGGGLPPPPARASPLYRLVEGHSRELSLVWDERFAATCGDWRAVIPKAVDQFLACGLLEQGFARIRCDARSVWEMSCNAARRH